MLGTDGSSSGTTQILLGAVRPQTGTAYPRAMDAAAAPLALGHRTHDSAGRKVHVPPWWGDASMAALIVGIGVYEALGHATRWSAAERVLLLGIMALAVLARTRHLWAAVTVMGAAFGAAPALGYHMDGMTSTLVGAGSIVWALGAQLRVWNAVWGTSILVVTATMGFDDVVGSLTWNASVMFAILAISRLLASRKRALTALAATARQLEASRDAEARAQVELERTRISRELHDVVAHAVSVMVVQASAAQSVLSTDPGRAQKALDSVQTTGREALHELRTMLSALRAEDGVPVLAPQPGLADVPALVDRVREGGLAVEVETDGPPHPLAPAADLTAYRVVQESLTNVVKHANATTARIAYHYGRGALRIDIEDDGAARPGAFLTDGSGLGLTGMRERVELCGGTLEAGPAPGRGFRVRASLPVVTP